MDPIKNPFSPGAGAPPPELVGRDPILEQARILLGRIKLGRPEKSLLLTGLRGVGKTVLLNAIDHLAMKASYNTIHIEAHENKPLAFLIAPHLRTLLFDLDRMAGASRLARKALGVFVSFVSALKLTVNDTYSIGLDIEPERGSADSGDLEIDLPNLLVAVGEAAQERGRAIAIMIDELQYLTKVELGALIMAMHRIQQRQLPIVLVAAGLPILPGLAGESKSYAERLFAFPNIGPLTPEEAALALQGPVLREGVSFEEEAIQEIFTLTRGYPYFLQEWGYRAWNLAATAPISLATVRDATSIAIQQLDQNFFRVRFDRLTPAERDFLRAMAELGPGPHRSGDIAAVLRSTTSSIGPTRSRLVNKGMIYSPSYGEIAFTVPLFDEFMTRTIPKAKFLADLET